MAFINILDFVFHILSWDPFKGRLLIKKNVTLFLAGSLVPSKKRTRLFLIGNRHYVSL